jgi:phage shock protein C
MKTMNNMETNSQPKKLYRSGDRVLGGVLAGFAEYINADVSIIRIVYVLLSIISAAFPGILVYIICWAVIPEKPLS